MMPPCDASRTAENKNRSPGCRRRHYFPVCFGRGDQQNSRFVFATKLNIHLLKKIASKKLLPKSFATKKNSTLICYKTQDRHLWGNKYHKCLSSTATNVWLLLALEGAELTIQFQGILLCHDATSVIRRRRRAYSQHSGGIFSQPPQNLSTPQCRDVRGFQGTLS